MEDISKFIKEELKSEISKLEKLIYDYGVQVLKNYNGKLFQDIDSLRCIVKKFPHAYEFIPLEFKNDTKILKSIILTIDVRKNLSKDEWKFSCFNKEVLDESLFLSLLNYDTKILKYIPKHLRNNKEILTKFMTRKLIMDYKYVSRNMVKPRHFLHYLNNELKNDYDFTLLTVKERGSIAFKYVSPRLRNDFEFAMEAIVVNPFVFVYASEELQNNEKFIENLLYYKANIIPYISDKFEKKFKSYEHKTFSIVEKLYRDSCGYWDFEFYEEKKIEINKKTENGDFQDENYLINYILNNLDSAFYIDKKLIDQPEFVLKLFHSSIDYNKTFKFVVKYILTNKLILFLYENMKHDKYFVDCLFKNIRNNKIVAKIGDFSYYDSIYQFKNCLFFRNRPYITLKEFDNIVNLLMKEKRT